MIDIENETLIPIGDVPSRLPPRPNGKRVHISAIYRWMSRGVRGIKLEVIKVGGSTYTSLEALQRFADWLSNRTDDSNAIKMPAPARRREIEKAQREVEEILGLRKAE